MSLLSDKMESRMCLNGAGGGGFGEREGDPDSPWNQGKGWEGGCRGAKNRLRWRRLLPFMARATGCRLHWEPGRGRDSWSPEALFWGQAHGFITAKPALHQHSLYQEQHWSLKAFLQVPSLDGCVCLFARTFMWNLFQGIEIINSF